MFYRASSWKLNDSEKTIKKELRAEILNSINEGFNVFISGMARGVDIWAAEIVIELKMLVLI